MPPDAMTLGLAVFVFIYGFVILVHQFTGNSDDPKK